MNDRARSRFPAAIVYFLRKRYRYTSILFAASCAALIAASSATSTASGPVVVWVGDQRVLRGVDTETNQFVKAITLNREATAAAIDPRDHSIWTLQNKQLVQLTQDGQFLRTVDLAVVSQTLGAPRVVVLDPYDSSLWVVSQTAVLHVSGTGNKLLEWSAPSAIQALDLDIDQSFWVLTKKQLIHVSIAGGIVATVDLKDHVSDPTQLAIDNLGGLAWVANKRKLVQFNSNNFSQTPRSIDFTTAPEDDGDEDEDRPPRIKTLNIHPLAGTLWLVSRNALYLFDRQGVLIKTVDLSPNQLGKIKTIAYDPITPALWLGGKTALGRFTSGGAFIARLPVDKSAAVLGVVSFKLSPTLSLIDPLDHALTNNPRPTLRFGLGASCSGIPCLLPDSYIRSLSLEVNLNGQAVGPLFQINGNEATFTSASRLPEGANSFTAVAKDLFGHRSNSLTASFTIDTIAPQFTALSPADGSLLTTKTATISGQVNDGSANVILGNSSGAGISMGGAAFSFAVTLQEGTNAFTLTAIDRAGNTTALAYRLTVDTLPPSLPVLAKISVGAIVNGQVTVTGAAGAVEAGARVTIKNLRTGESTTVTAAADGSFTAVIGSQAGDRFSIVAKDAANNTSDPVETAVSGPRLPPDPSTVATPINRTVPVSLFDSTAFLYSGANPIQTGVAAGTIEPRRIAVIRGRTLTRTGAPLGGVRVSVLNHPELGQTFTRVDGMFDLAVNGGGALTLNYINDGFLPAQRTLQTPWRDFVSVPDVVMIGLDPQVTPVDMNSGVLQVARGTKSSDSDGERQATLLFAPGTTASMLLPNGSRQVLNRLSVRATEYTVGNNGPKAMPADLPPQSSYTYAVELTADEALAAGASEVTLSQPVMAYVDNFIQFPAGEIVPVGYYDRIKGTWVSSDNGRVIKLLRMTNGLAELDIDGSNTAASGAALLLLGVTDAEREKLATLYPAGASFWRVPVRHFTPYDCNWAARLPPAELEGEPPDATDPKQPEPQKEEPQRNPCLQGGSIIECQNQVLGEKIELVGTGFSLHYRSDRVTGRKTEATLRIPLSGPTVPGTLKRIELEIFVAGRSFKSTFAPLPNQSYTFTWDGVDVYGRRLQGNQPVQTRVGYVYDAIYSPNPAFERVFATLPAPVQSLALARQRPRARQEVILSQFNQRSVTGIGSFDAAALGFGGWTLNVHHFYDPHAHELYLGDGRRRAADNLSHIYRGVAGGGTAGALWGGEMPAKNMSISTVFGIDAGPDGSVYFPEHNLWDFLQRVRPDGIAESVAGQTRASGPIGDGLPAVDARLAAPRDVAVGPDGSIYVTHSNSVRRITPDGIINTFAGGGSPADGLGDGLPARQAALRGAQGIHVGPDGALYISEGFWIRRVAPDGIIRTIAGNPNNTALGDGGPATEARFFAEDIALGPDGSLYLADRENGRIRRIMPNGVITTTAGGGSLSDGIADGKPATQARLTFPTDVAVAPNGGLYVTHSNRLRYIGPDGIITTVAGGGTAQAGFDYGENNLDGLLATQIDLGANSFASVAVGPDGRVFLNYRLNQRSQIVELVDIMPEFTVGETVLASEDGAQVYRFNSEGRHVDTRDTATGVVIYQFVYDARGFLTAVRDRDGASTLFGRGGNGELQRIVSPDGLLTNAGLDAQGYLARVARPDASEIGFSYTAEGLLTGYQDARANSSVMTYDVLGRLQKDENAAGGSWTLAHTQQPGSRTSSMTSALGRTKTYRVENLPSGDKRWTNVAADGTSSITKFKADGSSETAAPDGTVSNTGQRPDRRFGIQAPLTTNTIRTPGGSVSVTRNDRSVELSNPADLLSVRNITNESNVNGKVWSSRFTLANKQLVRTTPAGRQVTSTLDALGRVVARDTAALASESFAYDSRGRVVSTAVGTGTDERRAALSYGPRGFLDSVTDAEGRTVHFERDPIGRVTHQTLPGGRVVQWSYDANGNVVGITPPGKPRHSFAYTKVDMEEQYSPPAVSGISDTRTQYAYNLDKQLRTVARPDGQTADFSYDEGGRLSSVTLPGRTITYGYHTTTGQLSSLNTSQGQNLSYTYDGFLPLTESWSGPITGSVARSYNNDFLTTAISINGTNIPFSYDNDNLLTQAGSLAISRDAQNGLITGTTLDLTTTSQGYNSFGEINQFTANQGAIALLEVQYLRDKLGRITKKTETLGGVTDTYEYSYDLAGGLETVKKNGSLQTTYGYDTNGNRLSKATAGATVSGTYDDQDRLLTYGSTSYTYATNGDLRTKTNSGQNTLYTYDVLGNLTHVTLANGTTVEYVIDGRNRRVGKKVSGNLTQGFLYQDQVRPVAELDGNGGIVARFIYGTKINAPDYMFKGGVTYRIVSDHVGSPRLVINTSNGNIEQRLDYDEFGNVITDTNPGFQPFGFAGGLYDQHTKLIRFGSRDLDSETGRWTTKDPIRFLGGDTNLYGYAFNDPLNWIDPLGLYNGWAGWASVVVGVAAGAFLAAGQVPIALGLAAVAGALAVYDAAMTAEEVEKTVDQELEKAKEIQDNLDKIRELLEKERNKDRTNLPSCL